MTKRKDRRFYEALQDKARTESPPHIFLSNRVPARFLAVAWDREKPIPDGYHPQVHVAVKNDQGVLERKIVPIDEIRMVPTA